MDCAVHSKSIIAIYSDTTDPISLATDNNSITCNNTCILTRHWIVHLCNCHGSVRRHVSLLLNCSVVGVLMAQPLLRQKKITGASITAAKLSAAWKSPWTVSSVRKAGYNGTAKQMISGWWVFIYLTCATIAKVCDGTCVLFVHLQRVGSSNSMRELCSGK